MIVLPSLSAQSDAASWMIRNTGSFSHRYPSMLAGNSSAALRFRPPLLVPVLLQMLAEQVLAVIVAVRRADDDVDVLA
jgi:hypothetical protein